MDTVAKGEGRDGVRVPALRVTPGRPRPPGLGEWGVWRVEWNEGSPESSTPEGITVSRDSGLVPGGGKDGKTGPEESINLKD